MDDKRADEKENAAVNSGFMSNPQALGKRQLVYYLLKLSKQMAAPSRSLQRREKFDILRGDSSLTRHLLSRSTFTHRFSVCRRRWLHQPHRLRLRRLIKRRFARQQQQHRCLHRLPMSRRSMLCPQRRLNQRRLHLRRPPPPPPPLMMRSLSVLNFFQNNILKYISSSLRSSTILRAG